MMWRWRIGLGALGGLVFGLLASVEPTSVDRAVYGWIGMVRQPAAVAVATVLSDSLVVSGALLVAGIGRALARRQRLLASLAAAILLLQPGIDLLKGVIGRQRPDLYALSAQPFDGLSYPSGHAGLSLAFALTAAYVLTDGVPHWRRAALLTAILYGCLVGVSRVVLGAHYLSDVLGGFVLALVACLLAQTVWHARTGRF